jgi:hypothetical protein
MLVTARSVIPWRFITTAGESPASMSSNTLRNSGGIFASASCTAEDSGEGEDWRVGGFPLI